MINKIVGLFANISEENMKIIYNSIIAFFVVLSGIAIFYGYKMGKKYAKVPENPYIRKTDDIFLKAKGSKGEKLDVLVPEEIKISSVKNKPPKSKIKYFDKEGDPKEIRAIFTEDMKQKIFQELPKFEVERDKKPPEKIITQPKMNNTKIIDIKEIKK